MENNLKTNKLICLCLSYGNVFSSDECNYLISLFEKSEKTPLEINEDLYVRNSDIVNLPSSEGLWVSKRLSSYVSQANETFKFDIAEIRELQIIKVGTDGLFDWHNDIGKNDSATRKITIIAYLSKPEDYQGGQISFNMYDQKVEEPVQTRGNIMVFPSFRPHRSETVTSGIRYTLNCWVHGNSFR